MCNNKGIGAEKSMRVKQDDEREIDPKRRIMFRQIGAKIRKNWQSESI